jgi:hypothetical protein
MTAVEGSQMDIIALGQHTQVELSRDEEEEESPPSARRAMAAAPLVAPLPVLTRGRWREQVSQGLPQGGMHLMAAAAAEEEEEEEDEWSKAFSGGRSAPPVSEFVAMRVGSCSPTPGLSRRKMQAADAMQELEDDEEEEGEEGEGEGETTVKRKSILAESELEAIYQASKAMNFPPVPPTQPPSGKGRGRAPSRSALKQPVAAAVLQEQAAAGHRRRRRGGGGREGEEGGARDRAAQPARLRR